MRRMGANKSELIPTRGPPAVSEGKLNSFWEVVSRDIDRARRCRPRPQASPIDEEMGPITLPGCTTLQLLTDGEDVP